MKKILIIFALLIFVACHKESSKEYALIKGEIANKGETNKLTLTNNDHTFKYEIALLEDGSFQDTLFIESGLYTISAGHRKSTDIVFFNGDDLTLTFDANDLDASLKFEGKGAVENNVLQTINKKINGWDGKTSTLNEKEFKDSILKHKQELLSLLDNSDQINPSFKEQQKRYIDYWYLFILSRYQSDHSYYTKDADFRVSDHFFDNIKHIDYRSDLDYKGSSYYNILVADEHWKRTDSLMKAEGLSRSVAKLASANAFPSEFIRNALLYNSIMGTFNIDNTFKEGFDKYMELSTNPDHKKKVTERYHQVKVLEKGSPSPKFVDYENYNGTFNSLEQFKGKYVYIDVWATWCGPCKGEIPFLKEVEEKYHENENIVFVSISVDNPKDHNKWRDMVKEMELTGVQLMADNAFKSDFIKSYQIIGIPQFILIDPEGNIVNRRAPRPSSPDLIDLFNELGI